MEARELGSQDLKDDDENQGAVRIKNDNKKEENLDDEEENILIDMNSLPFSTKKDQPNIELAISGKTFEVLYRMNQKYEQDTEKQQPEKNPIVDKINDIPETGIAESFGNRDLAMEKDKQDNLNVLDPEKVSHYKKFHEVFRLILRYCSVYARCSPENKAQLVTSLKKENFTVLMCGDGANDCGALKVADVGVSLSTEEASIAAPFTSTTPDISCVIEVLKEGKCSLVTSIQTFKYMMMYSLIQFISVTWLMMLDSYLGDWEFMASDLFLITPLAFLIPMAPAYDKLTYHRPVSELISFPVISSMLIQTLCVGAFQIGAHYITNFVFPYLQEDAEYESVFCTDDGEEEGEEEGEITEEETEEEAGNGIDIQAAEEDEEEEDWSCVINKRLCYYDVEIHNCIDNSTNFYISFAQYLILAVVFCKGKPFKKSIIYNIPMFIFSIIGFIYAEYIVFYLDKFSKEWMMLVPYPDDSFEDLHVKPKYILEFKYYIMLIIVINFFFCLFIEKILIPKCNKCWRNRKMKRLQRKLELEQESANEADLNLINEVKNYIKETKQRRSSV